MDKPRCVEDTTTPTRIIIPPIEPCFLANDSSQRYKFDGVTIVFVVKVSFTIADSQGMYQLQEWSNKHIICVVQTRETWGHTNFLDF